MSQTEYLTIEDALHLIRALGVGPIRDLGLLDSALARPRASAFGVDAYATLELKAAALLHSLVANNPLVDGNKRLGWLATAVFVLLNDAEPALTDDEAFDLVMDVAAGESDLGSIAERLELRPKSSTTS